MHRCSNQLQFVHERSQQFPLHILCLKHFEKVHNYEVLSRDITVNNDAAVVNVQDAKEEVVSCHVCQNTFHNEDEKKNHDCLSKSTKIQCPTCLQVFKHMNSFKKHKLEHIKGT